MRRCVTAALALALALVGPALWALDEPKEKKKDKRAKPEQAYEALIKEYQDAQQHRRQKIQAQRLQGEGADPRFLGELVTTLPGNVPTRAVARTPARGETVCLDRHQQR